VQANSQRHVVPHSCQCFKPQASLKLEAAASYVEEARKGKEAAEAEQAAAVARAAEDEAQVGMGLTTERHACDDNPAVFRVA
jgi:hypothetical protein